MAQDEIKAFAAITKQRDTTPAIVVRWVLGDGESTDLPEPDDKFDVLLDVCAQDGTVVKSFSALVTPRKYIMLDPPRTPASPDGGVTSWNATTMPLGPVVPNDGSGGDLKGKPFGVVHLLTETDPARVEWRVARLLYLAMQKLLSTSQAFAGFTDVEVDKVARRFARNLLESRVRPRDILPQVRRAYVAMRESLDRDVQGLAARPSLLSVMDDTLAQRITAAALVVRALTYRPTRDLLDKLVAGAEQTRAHLRLRSFHGGDILDYWYDPDGTGAGNPADRGMRYPASEAIGCGCTFPVTAADLAQWTADKRMLSLTVSQRPRPPHAQTPLDSLEKGGLPGHAVAPQGRKQFKSTNVRLEWFALRAAVQTGLSMPIPQPGGARVDYALVSNNAVSDKQSPGQTFFTGDGKLDIVIDPATGQQQITVAAYNVYGIWEGAPGSASFFSEPPGSATLNDLQPWRMTRRYSLNRDLSPAFADQAGALPQRILDVLADPPWQPVLLQASKLRSETPGKSGALPLLDKPGQARFSSDLRKGMVYSQGWDPSLPPDTNWNPERRRDTQPSPGRPQRYRFWVTAVDALDQESEPVAVLTQDSEAGEPDTVFFEPRRRTPISAPPHDKGIALVFDEATQILTAAFQTPPESNVAGITSPDQPARLIDKSKLVAQAMFFRRPLRAQADTHKTTIFSAIASPSDLPQWLDKVADLNQAGWRPWPSNTLTTVNPPQVNDDWQIQSKQLEQDDHGWEYAAAIGFIAAPGSESYWGKNVTGRLRTKWAATKASDGSYFYASIPVNETPAASDVVVTNPCVIVNRAIPRSATIDPNTKLYPAKQVPAPPGVRRDLVLLRLLSQPAGKGAPAEPELWLKTGVNLTLGQKAMCETALSRTPVPGVVGTDDQRLETARAILAAALQAPNPAKPSPLIQHPSLGFRGLLNLQWTYTPLVVRPSGLNAPESDSAKFRIYTARAPYDAASADALSTAAGTGQLISQGNGLYRYDLTLTKANSDGWNAIHAYAKPTLATLSAGGADTVLATVTATFDNAGARQVEVLPLVAGTTMPSAPLITLFMAQPIAEMPATNLDTAQETPYSLYLPVGGGHKEDMAWWVVGVSAMGLETNRNTDPVWYQTLAATIEPAAPVGLLVRNALAETQDFLDPTNSTQKPWLPASISTLRDAQLLPRLVVSWNSDPTWANGEMIVIERAERQILKTGLRVRNFAVSTEWDAIKAIEATGEGQSIDPDAIALVQLNWLQGRTVEIAQHDTPPVKHVKPGQHLSAANGLAPVDIGGGKTNPGYIDYFGRNDDPVHVMDSNWEFSYRLSSFLVLDETLAEDWRYLYSMPSNWSEYCLPVPPPIQILAPSATQTASDKPAPAVVFTIAADAGPAQLRAMMMHGGALVWEYRAMLRRELAIPMPATTAPMAAEWIDIGNPVTFTLGGPAATITDTVVDRIWAGDVPQLHYQLFIQQFLKTVDENGVVSERLIRGFAQTTDGIGFKDVKITLGAPDTDGTEVIMLQSIIIL